MAEILALVFTDVVDSTLLNNTLGDKHMAAMWAQHDRSARELVRRWEGREVGRSDGFLLVFSKVSHAVGFAAAYHRVLASLSVSVCARVGVHAGPVNLRENSAADMAQGATPFEIDGLALPVAARIMAAAQGGQTLLSAQALGALGPTSLQTVSHGHWRLSGIAEPVELHAIGEAGTCGLPPPDSAKAYRVAWVGDCWLPVRQLPHSLPAERDAFVGRADALQALRERYKADARLVTLTGMGGVGKTRLSQRYARLCLGDHPGGAWFCDLSTATGLDGIVAAVARGLNVPLGRTDPVLQIGAAIAGRGACLVLFDNFEQVVGLAEQTVGAWLERAPQARFLVTSRELLGIMGEQVQVLSPMDSADGVAMFRQRVRAAGVQADFAPEDEEALPALIELLDHLPLAIELAAARVRVLSPRLLLQRMSDRLTLLAARGGRPDRQATLRATLDWSWGLMSVAERSALAQLSVFEGGFTLPAAEAVVDLSAIRLPPAHVNVVQSLVEKSLIREVDVGRLEMLRTVQEYAAEYLRAFSEDVLAGQALARHAAYYAGLHDTSSAAVLCAELDNLVTAVRRASAAGPAGTAVGALRGAWAAIKLRGPFRTAIELAECVRQAELDLDGSSRACVELVAAWGLKAIGRTADAEQRLLASLDAARSVGDRRGEGCALILLGELLTNAGRTEEARVALLAGLTAALDIGNLLLECEACGALGGLCQKLGALDEARSNYERALAAARQAADQRWEGGSLGNLGVTLADQGHNAEAEVCYRDALAISRELGDRQWEGNTLSNLGLLHHVQCRYAAAADELRLALRIARDLGHSRLECIVLCNLGMALEAANEPGRALEHYDAALRVARTLGDHRSEGQILGYRGLLDARQQRFDSARAMIDEGERLLLASADQLSLALLLCARAESEHLAGSPGAAAQALHRAQALGALVGAATGSELQQALARVQDLMHAARP